MDFTLPPEIDELRLRVRSFVDGKIIKSRKFFRVTKLIPSDRTVVMNNGFFISPAPLTVLDSIISGIFAIGRIISPARGAVSLI